MMIIITVIFLSILQLNIYKVGFPGGASGKEPACQCRRYKRWTSNPQVGKIPWRRAWQPTPVFLPGKSNRQRSLAHCSSQGCIESDTTEVTQHAHMYLQSRVIKFFQDSSITYCMSHLCKILLLTQCCIYCRIKVTFYSNGLNDAIYREMKINYMFDINLFTDIL